MNNWSIMHVHISHKFRIFDKLNAYPWLCIDWSHKSISNWSKLRVGIRLSHSLRFCFISKILVKIVNYYYRRISLLMCFWTNAFSTTHPSSMIEYCCWISSVMTTEHSFTHLLSLFKFHYFASEITYKDWVCRTHNHNLSWYTRP